MNITNIKMLGWTRSSDILHFAPLWSKTARAALIRVKNSNFNKKNFFIGKKLWTNNENTSPWCKGPFLPYTQQLTVQKTPSRGKNSLYIGPGELICLSKGLQAFLRPFGDGGGVVKGRRESTIIARDVKDGSGLCSHNLPKEDPTKNPSICTWL